MKKEPSDDSSKPYHKKHGEANKTPGDNQSRPPTFYERLAQNTHDLTGDINNQILGAITHQDLAEKFSRPINQGLARQYMAGKSIIDKMRDAGTRSDDFSGLNSDQIASVQAYQKVHNELPAKLLFVDREALIRAVENNIKNKAASSLVLPFKGETTTHASQSKVSEPQQASPGNYEVTGKNHERTAGGNKDTDHKPTQSVSYDSEKSSNTTREPKKDVPPAAAATEKPSRSTIVPETAASPSAPPRPHIPEASVLRTKEQIHLLSDSPIPPIPPPHPVDRLSAGERHAAGPDKTSHPKEALRLDDHKVETATKDENPRSLFDTFPSRNRPSLELLKPSQQIFVGRQMNGPWPQSSPLAQLSTTKISTAACPGAVGGTGSHGQSLPILSSTMERWQNIAAWIKGLSQSRSSSTEQHILEPEQKQAKNSSFSGQQHPVENADATGKNLSSDKDFAPKMTTRAGELLPLAQSKSLQVMVATKSVPLGRQFDRPEIIVPVSIGKSGKSSVVNNSNGQPDQIKTAGRGEAGGTKTAGGTQENTDLASAGVNASTKNTDRQLDKDGNIVPRTFIVKGLMPDKRYITGGELAFVAVMALASASRVRQGVSREQALAQHHRQYILVESEGPTPPMLHFGKYGPGAHSEAVKTDTLDGADDKRQTDKYEPHKSLPDKHATDKSFAGEIDTDRVTEQRAAIRKKGQEKKVLLRPQILVQEDDNLCDIADALFNDSRLGHLIADLNSSAIEEECTEAARIIRLKTRQRLTLPVYQDVIDYDKRLKELKKRPLITVVETSAIDNELFDERFEGLSKMIGIDSSNIDPLDKSGQE